ncbi:MAG: CoA transferase [Phycisphaerales bacterium]|nr:CoA transferase [Phycisphaerales bacterium]
MPSLDCTPPIAGITVIDLGRVLAAPFATSVLASLGARVIKVERPGAGDDARAFGPHHNGKSLYFTSVNCDKESIALDLKVAEDRAIFEQLLDRADVLVENFSPGVMDALGYDWDTIHARWPRVIYGALSGFGKTGPLSGAPAYDIVVQALGGMMSLTGFPKSPPVRVGASIGDLTAALYMALGIVSAIHKRTRTGEGCLIDIAMLDCQVAILEAAVTTFTATGEVPQRLGSRHPSIAPFQAFQCKDQWIVIGAGNDALFRTLCMALDRSDLLERAEFSTNPLRLASMDSLERELNTTLTAATAQEWISRLMTAGIPCAPIQSVAEMAAMPQVAARGMIVPVDDPMLAATCVPGNPIKMSSVTPRFSRGPAPALDEHRHAILAELAVQKNGRISPPHP